MDLTFIKGDLVKVTRDVYKEALLKEGWTLKEDAAPQPQAEKPKAKRNKAVKKGPRK